MNACFKGFAAAALLCATFSLPVYAEDAPAATASPAASTSTQAAPTQATPNEATPAPSTVPRPALVPKATDATTDATTEPAPRRHRHYARYHYRRYAYWEPFPIFFPHLYRSHIVWNRVRWFSF